MPSESDHRWLAQPHGLATAQFHTRILNAWHAAGNLLFPPVCVFCGSALPSPAPHRPVLCSACQSRIIHPGRSACRRCASTLPAFWPDEGGCPHCQDRHYHFSQAVALGTYRGDLQQVVLRMKRPMFEPLACTMGWYLAERLRDRFFTSGVDLIVPVPMHWWRRLRRGTYPAQLLAATVGQAVRIPVFTGVLQCQRKAKKQGTLRPAERFRNVRGVFCVSSGYDITDANVLIVDDIMTTGATASEAARVLRRAGARAVYVAVVARGGG